MKLNIGGQQTPYYKGHRLQPRQYVLEGWTCVDILPGADIICDIQKQQLPFDEGAASAIYCSHVLEHLWSWNYLFTMKEFYRVLEPDGKLRIVVPDMDIGIDWYLKHLNKKRALPAFMRWWFDPTIDDKGEVHFGHVGGFNYSSLVALIEESGFRNVKRSEYNPKSGVFVGCDNPELELTSLYIEAIK